jgi:hypothetical protein
MDPIGPSEWAGRILVPRITETWHMLPAPMVRQAHHEGLILSSSKDEARLT